MLNEDIVLKWDKYILKRFEHNLNGGTIILFNVNSFDIWFGNLSAYDLLKDIDGNTSLHNLYKKILYVYKDYSDIEVKKSFDAILQELIEKQFLKTI